MVPMPPAPATSRISRPGKIGANSAADGGVNGSSTPSEYDAASYALPHSTHAAPGGSEGMGELHRLHSRMVSISAASLTKSQTPGQRLQETADAFPLTGEDRF